MKKNRVNSRFRLGSAGNLLKKMKLLIFLFFASLLGVSASTYSQATKLSLNLDEVTVKEAFRQIERNSEFVFFYNEDYIDVNRKVNINVRDEKIETVLNEILKGTKNTYKIYDRQIVISPPEKKELPTPMKSGSEVEQSQKKEISGIVKDSKGLSLPGVTVVVKGTTTGTLTDGNGKFKIMVPIQAKTLLFSFVGMKSQEIFIDNNTSISVTMVEEKVGLDEVVVIGYGSVLKSELGGTSVSSVGVTDLKKAPVISFEQALAGRAAGVQVTSSEGGPFALNNIVIRGNNSVTQNNSPLWVIDGFPIENPDNNTLDPSNIKSITVLKDAASTAIYGSRGANGVIVVTTNQGKAGAPVVTFDGYYGFQQNLKLAELLNPYEYVKLQSELMGTGAKQLYTPGDPTVGATYVPGGRTLDYYKTAPSVNWQKMMYRTAPMQNYSMSLSGGTDKSRYMISGSMTDQEGIIVKTGFKRYQGRIVFNQEINEKTNFNLNVNYANTTTEGQSPSNLTATANSSLSLLYAVWGYRPAISPNSSLDAQLTQAIDPDGQLAYAYNPLISTNNTIINSSSNNLAANAYLDYKIIKDLTLRISGGLNYTQSLNNSYYGQLTQRGAPTGLLGPDGSIANSRSSSLLNENTLNYKKVFNNKHIINLLLGFSTQTTKVNNSSDLASQVPNDALGVSGIDEGTPYSIGAGSSQNFLCSYFGRINYNYNSKYFLTAVARADGSSKFAPGNQWGYFPSGAIAWDISKENFLKGYRNLSELKLRGSYGISGNNRVSDFAYLSPISLSNIATSYAFGNAWTNGAVQPTLGNKGLKWETTATTDIGLDLGFIHNRVQLVADYYKKVTSNLLLQATTPGHIGYTTALKNIGSVSNSGWEFTLNTMNVTHKNFNWNSNFNISFNHNEVLALNSGQQALISTVYWDTNPQFPYIAQVGGPISQIIGYKWLGNYQYPDFDQLPNGTYVLKGNIPANGNTRTTIKPGDIKYEDINGDGLINDADKIVIGNPNPLFTGGFSNDFTYKGFDLNVLLSFSYGNDILNANRMAFEGAQAGYVNQFATFANRWTPENQTNLYPRAGGTIIGAVSSRVIEDGSFLRLKTVSLGYRIPQDLLQKINVKSARIYCSAQNLAVWSKYRGSDPEVSTRPGALTQGFDFAAYPRAFTLVFGFNFSF